MGADPSNSPGTEEYMSMGGIPTFKIYDASEDIYFDATPSEDFPWSINGFNFIDNLAANSDDSGEAITDGCDLPGGTLYLSDDNDGSVLYNSPAGCTYYDEQSQFVISYDQDECSAQANPELFDGNIGGFQFNVDGATVNSGSGGDMASYGLFGSAAGSTFLAFSFTGGTIPAGCGTLVNLSLSGDATGLSNIIVSDATGSQLYFEYYEGSDEPVLGCTDESACNYNVDATDTGTCTYEDECGVCDSDFSNDNLTCCLVSYGETCLLIQTSSNGAGELSVEVDDGNGIGGKWGNIM